jgi:hypothetical protein
MTKALFASLEGKGREEKAKKEETSERSREVWEEMSLEGYFFFITQKPPQFGGTQKLYYWIGVWRESSFAPFS